MATNPAAATPTAQQLARRNMVPSLPKRQPHSKQGDVQSALFRRLYTGDTDDIKEKVGVFQRRSDNICEFSVSAGTGF
jgi:hypothetical protein